MSDKEKDIYVYRVWDPEEKKFVSSGRGLYGKPRTGWFNLGGAKTAMRYMKKGLVIKKYKLVEVDINEPSPASLGET